MKLFFTLGGVLAVTFAAFAADPAPVGGYKTHIIENPTSTTIKFTEKTIPSTDVFDGKSFKVYLEGKDVTSATFTPAAGDTKPTLKFDLGQSYLLVRDGASSAPENVVKGRHPLPVAFGGIGHSKSGAEVAFVAQPYYIFNRVPLAWDAGVNSYSSGITVFYVLEPDTVTPPPNFTTKIHFEASNGTVAPQDAVLTVTERSQRVVARTPSLDRPIVVTMKIEDRELKVAAFAEGELGAIKLTSTTTEILGFGTGQAAVRVERFDPLDRPLAADEPLSVSFSVDSAAAISPASATIPAGASSVEVVVKSTTFGLATITAKTTKGPSASLKMKVRAVLGGLTLKSDVAQIVGFGTGQAVIRVQRVDPAGAPLKGEEALPVTIAINGPVHASPMTATIPAGSSDVTFSVKSTGFGVATITASAGGKTSPPISLGVRSVLGGVKLTATKTDIADFGAGQTELEVQRLDPAGSPMAAEDALLVTFAINGPGKLTPSTVTIPAGENKATVNLKSTGEGAISIVATAEGVSSEAAKISLTKSTHSIKVTPEKISALGLGLGRAKFTLTRRDAGEKSFADPQPLSVPLTISGPGVLEQSTAEFKSGEASTTVTVQGGRTGTAVLAISGPISGSSGTVDFVWPWALLLGAVVGGGAAIAMRHSKKAEANAPQRPLVKRVIVAAIVGVIILAIALVGSKIGLLPQSLVATFAGGFSFAAVLGFVGTFLVDGFQSQANAPAVS